MKSLNKNPLVEIHRMMTENELWLALAESCTGGLLGSRITDLPGASQFFLGSVVSYAYPLKSDILKVSRQTLDQHGAVSKETAQEMACGVRAMYASSIYPADRIVALSITGIAGPGGGTAEKPVGLVWMGIASRWDVKAQEFHAFGERHENKYEFSNQALFLLLDHLTTHLENSADEK